MTKFIIFWWYVIPSIVNHCLGRWYVLRNCPQWVIEELVKLEEPCKTDKRAKPDVKSFIQEAIKERELRMRNKQK